MRAAKNYLQDKTNYTVSSKKAIKLCRALGGGLR